MILEGTIAECQAMDCLEGFNLTQLETLQGSHFAQKQSYKQQRPTFAHQKRSSSSIFTIIFTSSPLFQTWKFPEFHQKSLVFHPKKPTLECHTALGSIPGMALSMTNTASTGGSVGASVVDVDASRKPGLRNPWPGVDISHDSMNRIYRMNFFSTE